MDAPKCKMCGERHALGACPQFHVSARKQVRGVEEGSSGRHAPRKRAAGKSEGKPVKVQAVAPPPAKAPFDRKAYQRNYMREYRAKAKFEANK
jgi:hypothetical protein